MFIQKHKSAGGANFCAFSIDDCSVFLLKSIPETKIKYSKERNEACQKTQRATMVRDLDHKMSCWREEEDEGRMLWRMTRREVQIYCHGNTLTKWFSWDGVCLLVWKDQAYGDWCWDQGSIETEIMGWSSQHECWSQQHPGEQKEGEKCTRQFFDRKVKSWLCKSPEKIWISRLYFKKRENNEIQDQWQRRARNHSWLYVKQSSGDIFDIRNLETNKITNIRCLK